MVPLLGPNTDCTRVEGGRARDQIEWEHSGGDRQARTADPLLAKQVLFQLSYIPTSSGVPIMVDTKLVGLSGFEPETSRLSAVRSNQLS